MKGQTRGSKDRLNLFQREAGKEQRLLVAGKQLNVFSQKGQRCKTTFPANMAVLGPCRCHHRRRGVTQSRFPFLWVSSRRVKTKQKTPGEAGSFVFWCGVWASQHHGRPALCSSGLQPLPPSISSRGFCCRGKEWPHQGSPSSSSSS